MRPPVLYKGEDKTIVVEMNTDISAATEIEFYIDTDSQIKKTLSGGDISGVTATQFSVAIVPGDTDSVNVGSYRFQARATLSSKLYHIKFTPNKIVIEDSIFLTSRSVPDYGG